MDTVHCKAFFGQGVFPLSLFHSLSRLCSFVLLKSVHWSSNGCEWDFGFLGLVGDVPVFLAKPQTYMNLSGESVIT